MRKLITLATVFLMAMFLVSIVAKAQDGSRVAHSNGQGTLKVGEEKFKVTSVIVKLMDDHKAEVTLISDITVFLNANWSNSNNSPQEFDLEITGGASAGGMGGSGKVILGSDGKSVARLNVKGVSRTTKRVVEVAFEGK